ncbi:MAG: aldehyde ferredoxin oxidoreductase family protein [Proteobacteria bacterium]|nr:aldehyde ferredoxin oxidoreductase family protein [Pseudomonadota bacterium]
MPKGYNGIILRVDLSSKEIDKEKFDNDFYRTYMGGGAIGAYFLLKETKGNLDAFDEKNILTIAPSVVTGSIVSGASRCSVVGISPLTGAVGEGQAGGSFGPLLKRAGYDALVITGRAKKPSYLHIDNEKVEIREASHLSGKSVGDVYDILIDELGSERLSIIQCGPAGEKRVRFASLMVDRNNVVGRTGMGAAMGGKNLRAVAVRGTGKIDFADSEALKGFNRTAKKRLPTSGFPAILQKSGTPGVVAIQAKNGNLATHNFSRSYHEDHEQLDAAAFENTIGSGKATCLGCMVACRKRVRSDTPYQIGDKLGGPEFETLSLLGSNLDISEAAAVAKANELCNQYGLDTITMGAIAAYFIESMEKGTISSEENEGKTARFGSPEDLFQLIRQVAEREDVGDILAEGFKTAIEHFGGKTAPFAIHSKGQGLPAHMAQVKPSQALMYAVCPIGGDHMSSEHDWFLDAQNEDCRSLGIFGEGDARSSNLAKVRMTVYSQYFYSLLDTLTLCMFVWGPGNLFSYRELEDLLQSATGWKCTLWEMMKVGERKINMMRQINARCGFDSRNDVLPDRLYEPLPDGPAKGACVDRKGFAEMVKQYYELMGWAPGTGNPTPGKLLELGLDWV